MSNKLNLSDLKRDGEVPLTQQLVDRFVEAIETVALEPGEKLPTTRALAADAGVNHLTAARVYRRLAELGSPLEAALSFDVTEEELLRRLAGRAAAQHRADDAEQTIRHRLEVFAIKTRPLIDYYAHRGLLVNVDAIGPIEVVTKRILDDLEGNRRPG